MGDLTFVRNGDNYPGKILDMAQARPGLSEVVGCNFPWHEHTVVPQMFQEWIQKGWGAQVLGRIRLYYTYAQWNEAAQRAANEFNPGSALSDTGSFGNALHGSNFGVQVEYWWK